MAFYNENTVITDPVIVTWDGLSNPEQVPATADKDATVKYKISFAFDPNSPSYGEMYQITEAEANKKYPNGRPGNFQGAFGNANEGGKIPEVQGMVGATASTFGTFPNVFDANGQMLDAAAVSRVLYPGAKVKLLVSPRVYDAKGNKGVTFWLTGVMIVDANPATSPRLAVAAAGMSASQAASAFGIANPGMVAAAPVAAVPPVPGAPAIPMPPGAPVGAPAVPMPPGVPAPVAAVPPVPGAPAAPAAAVPPVPAVPNAGILAGGVGAPPVPGAPAAPAAPPAPAAPAAPVRQMTAAAGGVTYEAYIASGWNDAQLVQHGLMLPLA